MTSRDIVAQPVKLWHHPCKPVRYMMNDRSRKKSQKLATASDNQIIETLQRSLYPGASSQSVAMVMTYCQQRGLDVFQKPVHIVPMYIRNPNGNGGSMQDVIMPGISLYRTNAQSSGEHAGTSEPEYGDMKTEEFRDEDGTLVSLSFPEWAKVTVYKQMPNGEIVEFSAKEYWLENYATKSKKSQVPNAMWQKRARGQIAKCAEAQALRRAWPNLNSGYTYEEMDGKHYDYPDAIEGTTVYADPEPKAKAVASEEASRAINAQQLRVLTNKAKNKGVPLEAIAEAFELELVEDLPFAYLNDALTFVDKFKADEG